jgi:hypothetical protein
MLNGCDGIFKRQVIIDLANNKARSFSISEPGDLMNLFSRIEQIAGRNGLECRPYNSAKKIYSCYKGTVSLVGRVRAGKAVSIELTQFGPWSETEEFTALEKDLSAFIREEFPGQNLQITNPAK